MADQRAVNDVQDSVHEDTEMHEAGGETDRPDNEYGNEEDADDYEDDYPEPTMMRDMFFENPTEELGYLLSQSESRAPSPDPNADMGEPLTAEEERADAKYRISRLTYHLSLSNTANERLQDARTALIADKEKVMQAAKEAAKEAEEKIKDAEEKVNALKLQLETYKQAAIRDAIAQEKKVAQLQLQMERMSVQNNGIAPPAAVAPAVVAVASNEIAMLSPPVAVPPTAIAIGAQGYR
ncbi:uncharacterized protein J4E87_006919 [Alternaria ethzedia]|uniref:uncharacterized protein n=1 Tax=Alternaria ethzedia TaxID=181014 RepID=UPI0020C20BE0|nr:uncharacterized protein J4E87_006919 [Alternaria ethzedia]KAI4621291.1 hypothetical protein J4E87_006919 [Alternaria ethzedia]